MKPLPQSVRIRRMTLADLPQVVEIAGSLPQAPHWPPSSYINALNPDSNPRRIALVIVLNSTDPAPEAVVGFAIASLVTPQAELETIAVAAGSQRRSFGQHLFQAFAHELITAGASEILLEVRPSNHVALAYYRALGFAETSRRPSYYTDPIEDAVLMSLCPIESQSPK